MDLVTILNHHHQGFTVYHHARFSPDHKHIDVDVRSRAGSSAICSGCDQPAPGYDQLPERGFEFIPFWGFLVFLRYACGASRAGRVGVVVEAVPWSDGKHPLTRAYMLFLARWARQLSWKETAEAFHVVGHGVPRRRVCGRLGAGASHPGATSGRSAWMKSNAPKATNT